MQILAMMPCEQGLDGVKGSPEDQQVEQRRIRVRRPREAPVPWSGVSSVEEMGPRQQWHAS